MTIVLCAAGCLQIDGGAAELSWALRSYDGDDLGSGPDGCGRADTREVRLCWAPESGGVADLACRVEQRRTFSCAVGHGATGFDITPGPTAFWLEPVCANGVAAKAGTFDAPAPIVREVVDGQVVTLSSLLLVVSDNAASAPTCGVAGCTCAP